MRLHFPESKACRFQNCDTQDTIGKIGDPGIDRRDRTSTPVQNTEVNEVKNIQIKCLMREKTTLSIFG